MSDSGRLAREQEFHNEAFSKDKRSQTNKYYNSANKGKDYYHQVLWENIGKEKILLYGCGKGGPAMLLAKKGAVVSAIDISDWAIEESKRNAKKEQLAIDFQVMDAENLSYSDNLFDKICGSGILHHLNVEKAYNEIRRTLKRNGKAVFFEPLGHNFLINLYRNFTPSLRTEDEHPLLMKDIELAKKYFKQVEVSHFNLFATFGAFLPVLSSSLHKLDSFLFSKFSFLKRYSWIVVLEFSDPR